MPSDDTLVDKVERAEVGKCVGTLQLVVVPRPIFGQPPRKTARYSAKRCDALGEVVNHLLNTGMLWIEHLVHPDEGGADNVPVDVFQRQ